MKLVEILARELKEWPEDCIGFEQAIDGDICADRDATKKNYRHLAVSMTLAEDWISSYVTRAQWEAERARIAAMDGISEFSQEQANAEAEHEHRTQYEQELWDKVALDAQAMIFDAAGQEEPLVDIARRVGLWADAFMAERAKRLKERK